MSLEYYDKQFELPPAEASAFRTDEWCSHQSLMCHTYILTFDHALFIPRRLGGSASGSELARDKQTFRRLTHLYTQLRERWRLLGPCALTWDYTTDASIKHAAAVMDQAVFIRNGIATAERQRALWATRCDQKGRVQIGRSGIALYSLEISELERISVRLSR